MKNGKYPGILISAIMVLTIMCMTSCAANSLAQVDGSNKPDTASPVITAPASVPSKDAVPLDYPLNASGQTYGSAGDASSIETLPDLMLVGSVNGVHSYIYTKDLLDAMPKTEDEARAIVNNLPSFPLYEEDGVTAVSGSMGYCPGLLPASVRSEYLSPLYPVNDNGQTYGPDLSDADTSSPDLVACVGIDGTDGYCYKTDLDGYLPNTPEEALDYMKQLQSAKEESGYTRVIPLYASDGKTVIGKFGIG